MKAEIYSASQIGIMLSIGKTYHEKWYMTIELPFFTVRIEF